MANQDWMVIFGLAVIFVVVGLAAWNLLRLFRWIRKFKSAPEPVSEPTNSTSSWIWVFLIAVVGLISYMLSGGEPAKEPAPDPTPSWLRVVIVFGLILGVFVVLIGYQLYRQYDRAASRALKRGNAGDTAGAIAELRDAIEASDSANARPDDPSAARNPYAPPRLRRKGSPVRANTMGLLHSMREEWSEAYEWFVKAEEIGGREAICLGNQGLMLWKMGRPTEAVVVLEEACKLAPQEVLLLNNLGLVLVDLGRIDEAREKLALAEVNFKKLILFPASAKIPIGAEIESLRKKLEVEPGSPVS